MMLCLHSNAFSLPFTITPTVIQPTCNGGGTFGTISVSINPPSASGCIYKVYKNGDLLVQIDASIANLNSLEPGTYKIVVLNKSTNELDSFDNIVLDPYSHPLLATFVIDSPRCDTSRYGGKITTLINNDSFIQYPLTYTWSHNALEKDSIADSVVVSPDFYKLTITDKRGCLFKDSVKVVEKQGKMYVIKTDVVQTSCDSPNGSINIEVGGNHFLSTYPYNATFNFDGKFDFKWVHGDSMNMPLDSLAAGFYTCYFYDTMACYPLIIKDIEVKQFPAPEIKITGTDSVCYDQLGKLNLEVLKGDTSTLMYDWQVRLEGNTLSQTRKLETADTGTYYAIAIDNIGCRDTAEFVVTNYPRATLKLTSDAPNNTIVARSKTIITLTVDTPFTLAAMKNLKWDISPSLNLTSPTTGNATPLTTTNYRVEANYGPGCYTFRSITIDVIDPSTISDDLKLNTILSPNGDGINETLKISDLSNSNSIVNKIESFEIAIYDRWGSKVYESFEKNFEWRGTDPNGNLVQNGVYPYVIKYTTLESLSEKIINSGALFIEK